MASLGIREEDFCMELEKNSGFELDMITDRNTDLDFTAYDSIHGNPN